MSSQSNKEMFRMVIEEAINKGNFDVLYDIFDPNFREHQFQVRPTIEGMIEGLSMLRTAFPDVRMTIDKMTADENTVWGLMTVRGTNDGPLMGPPTGKPVEFLAMDVLRFENGRVVEHWGTPDRFAMIAQLGLLPQPQ